MSSPLHLLLGKGENLLFLEPMAKLGESKSPLTPLYECGELLPIPLCKGRFRGICYRAVA